MKAGRVLCFIVLVAAIVAAGCTIVGDRRCGVENCHGTNISCGDDVPQACTAEYQLGDRCRSHVECRFENGTCAAVAGPAYEPCLACVRNCSINYPGDPARLFECEGRC
jgi:hypothetical protein